jgi:modulator of FtsH protease
LDNFAIVTGGASGALTGLLFVAVSLNRDRIAGHRAVRGVAGQTLVLFLLPLLPALLLMLPRASATSVGAGWSCSPLLVVTLLTSVGGVVNAWLFLTR